MEKYVINRSKIKDLSFSVRRNSYFIISSFLKYGDELFFLRSISINILIKV